ncbi:MAG: hypothetical protein PGMFKBFP_01602 [Anaerolineales bacterium]|nr:hypothetical protein [Anaerolineales bacterium]
MHNWLAFNFVISNFIFHILIRCRVSSRWKESVFKHISKIDSVDIFETVAQGILIV